MYADTVTPSMRAAITETERRRKKQDAYNKAHGIVPQTIIKACATSSRSPRTRGQGLTPPRRHQDDRSRSAEPR